MALKIPMTFAQCLLSTIMETAFSFVPRIWKPRCLKKHRVGRREPFSGVMVEDPRVDGTGAAVATMAGGAGCGLTGAGCTIAYVSVVDAGIVAGPVEVSGGVVAATATGVKLFSLALLSGALLSFLLHNHVLLLLHNCALTITLLFCVCTMHINLIALSVVSVCMSTRG